MYPIPKEAYSYWPSGDHCLIETKQFVERLIFSRQSYKDWESSSLFQLNKLVKDTCVHDYLDNSEKLRFLYGCGWKFSEALQMLSEHIQWKQEWPSYKLIYPLITQILNSGGVYIHGRDHRYRPLIVITPKKLMDFPQHLLMATAYFLLEHTKDHMLLPGQIENWVLVVDLQGFNYKDYSFKIIEELLKHYPCRLARAFVFNSNKLVSSVLKLFSSNTSHKITVVGEGKNPLIEICNPEQVEVKFGGNLENTLSFWPPITPSSNYRAAGDPEGGFLSAYSSYDEYFTLPAKMYSDLSSLRVSQHEEYKDSFISNSEFRDEIWQKLDIVSGSFSFLHTDILKVQESEPETMAKHSEMRGKSEDMTRASSNGAKKVSMEHEVIESNCCIESSCVLF